MKLEIEFPHPDRVLSPNTQVPLTTRGARVHNIKRVEAKKEAREGAFSRAFAATLRLPQRNFPAREVSAIWFYKGPKPDIDNVVARLKPLIDGCAKAFGINDRDLELGRVRRVHTLGKNAGKIFLIFDTETTQ
jgi:Holliday junction resolvase RusA-like endonuclease